MPNSDEHRFLVTIPNVLGLQACANLITEAESIGFDPAIIRYETGAQRDPGVRNNDRLEWTNPEFAAELWEQVKDRIPETIEGHPVAGLDDWFRFYRYTPGQRFRAHRDGITRKPNQIASRLSFLVFLNEAFEGGETIFYEERTQEGQRIVKRKVKPETGMVLYFTHSWRHEGSPVTEGTKYVLRTDVLYDLSTTPRSS